MLRVAAEDKETETPKGSLFALGEFVHKTGHLVQKCYTKLEHCVCVKIIYSEEHHP